MGIKKARILLRARACRKIATLLGGNAARSKIKDFRTALYPRQYHPSILENPLNKRVFAYNVFFRRACQRKNEKCGVNAAKIEFGVYRQTEARILLRARLYIFY